MNERKSYTCYVMCTKNMDKAEREYHKVVDKCHKWFSTPGSKSRQHPIRRMGYDRDLIMSQNPNAADVINLNKHVITIDMQDESCGAQGIQRSYVEFLVLDTYAKKIADCLENDPHIIFFTGPADNMFLHTNVKGKQLINDGKCAFNLSKLKVDDQKMAEIRKRYAPHGPPGCFTYDDITGDQYHCITNFWLPASQVDASDLDYSYELDNMPAALKKHRDRVWIAEAIWDEYCEEGSAQTMLTTIQSVLEN